MRYILPSVESIGPIIGVVVCTVAFVALLVWTFSARRKKAFDDAANIPLND